MTPPVRQAERLCKVTAIVTAAAFCSGCGPKVTMTVQVQDAQGNTKSFTVTSSDSASKEVPVALDDTITVTSSAT